MDDLEHREKLMQSDVLLVATAAASLLNGLPSSPVLFLVLVLLKPLLAGGFLGSALVVTYLASFLASAATLLIAGVPAAIFERVRGQQVSSTASLGVWFVATLLLVGLPRLAW